MDDSFIFCESEMNKDLSQRFEKELERYSLGKYTLIDRVLVKEICYS